MTPEQLDEIEKLAVNFKSAAFHDLMARQTLPLVKALREARARCETLRELADEKAHEAGLYARRMEQAQIAGRGARSEVERLRSVLRQVHALAEKSRADWPRHTAWGALVDIHTITKGMVE